MTIDQQRRLDGTDFAKIKFVGARSATPGQLHLGDEIVFKLTGLVVHVGEELDADGVVSAVATVKVSSIVPS